MRLTSHICYIISRAFIVFLLDVFFGNDVMLRHPTNSISRQMAVLYAFTFEDVSFINDVCMHLHMHVCVYTLYVCMHVCKPFLNNILEVFGVLPHERM